MDREEAGWLSELLSDSRQVVLRLYNEPLQSLQILEQQVIDYQLLVKEQATAVTDVDLANQLAANLLMLLASLQGTVGDAIQSMDEAVHRSVQVAVRYFVESDDADDDLTSPYGFDDDAEVFNGVARRLGRADLVLAVV